VGEKRLHYAVTDTWLVFASEINAVLVHPALKSEHELTMVPRCLTFNVDGHAAGLAPPRRRAPSSEESGPNDPEAATMSSGADAREGRLNHLPLKPGRERRREI